jgi:hypothetical protein
MQGAYEASDPTIRERTPLATVPAISHPLRSFAGYCGTCLFGRLIGREAGDLGLDFGITAQRAEYHPLFIIDESGVRTLYRPARADGSKILN